MVQGSGGSITHIYMYIYIHQYNYIIIPYYTILYMIETSYTWKLSATLSRPHLALHVAVPQLAVVREEWLQGLVDRQIPRENWLEHHRVR